MAKSPQLEDGYTSIANELLEAIYNTHFSEYESRTFWFIVRMTYGWKHKMDTIALSQFEKGVIDKDGKPLVRGLNINHSKICQAINCLVSRNIIIRKKDGYITSYGLQKDYDGWDKKAKLNTKTSVHSATSHSATSQLDTVQSDTSPKDTPPVSNQTLPSVQPDTETSVQPDTETSVQPDTHQINERNKETITKTILPKKDIYGEFQNVKLTKEEYDKLVIKFGEIIAKEKIENLSGYIASVGKKYSNHYATILTWSRKDDKDKNNGHKQNNQQPIVSNDEMVKINEDWIKQHGGQNV
jgi:phage replication O-like protein O